MEHSLQTSWLDIQYFLALGLFTSWGAISFILEMFSIIDGPSRGRDFHHDRKTTVPRVGGVGLVVSFAAVSLAIYFFQPMSQSGANTLGIIVLSSLAMFALGFWDDLRPLRARWKLIMQIVIAAAVYFSGIRIEILKNPITEIDFTLGIFSF
jgi:UDP-GlcNAc:undecaprenyl-phosphate GlcNAc-1-phosphate transferase